MKGIGKLKLWNKTYIVGYSAMIYAIIAQVKLRMPVCLSCVTPKI